MKRKLIYNIIGLAILITGIVSCDQASQEASPIVEPDASYPVVTGITLETTGTIREGDTIVYTIAINKPLTHSLTFSAIVDSTATTLVEHEDFDFEGGTIPAWETEGELWIVSHKDFIPEPAGVVAFDITLESEGEKYTLHPDNEYPPTQEITINPGLWLDITMEWSSSDDIDFVIFKEDNTDPYFDINYSSGATLDMPEGSSDIGRDDVGTYYIGIIHWGVPAFDYTFTFGSASDGIETITGTFNSDYLRAYDIDPWTAWGGVYHAYRVIKVVNDGTNYTVTKLDEYTSADYMDPADLVGTWSGTDGAYPNWAYATNTVEVTEENGESYIYGLNEGWMTNFWGESVTSGEPVVMRVYSNGDVWIPYSYYWETLYDGDPYDYWIYGSGTYDAGTGLHLEYEMDQDGFLCAAWTYENDYNDYEYFQADLTMSKGQIQNNYVEVPENFVKPERKANRTKKEIIK
ncbi:MAG: hypothetical protein KQH79_04840 [Bacteroidetes bacterium]|nr:hypothetical protein [Bacteroidota bacterium]